MASSTIIHHSQGMEALGASVCHGVQQRSKSGIVITLSGPLGAGKTTFVRGYLRGMDFQGIVKSPTYTLVEPYELPLKTIYHFDFYRLTDPQELELMGIRDYFQTNTDCLIEWPEKALGFIPKPDLQINIDFSDEQNRTVLVTAESDRGQDVLSAIHF